MINYNTKTAFDKTVDLEKQLFVRIWMIQYKLFADNFLEFLERCPFLRNKLETD